MELIEKVTKCLVVDTTKQIILIENAYRKFAKDPEIKLIIEKINNFNNITSKMTEEEFQLFIDKDWETEIWLMI